MLENVTRLATLKYSFFTDSAFLSRTPDISLSEHELWLVVRAEVAGLKLSTTPVRIQADTLAERLLLRQLKSTLDRWLAVFVGNLRLKYRNTLTIAEPMFITAPELGEYGIPPMEQNKMFALQERFFRSADDKAKRDTLWIGNMVARANMEQPFHLAASVMASEHFWLYRGQVVAAEAMYSAEEVRAAMLSKVIANGMSGPRQPIPERTRAEVWRRDQGRCVRCSSREKLEFDHIIPYSKGGSDTVRNLQLLCERCNRTKGANGF